jgi:hypothetical protein
MHRTKQNEQLRLQTPISFDRLPPADPEITCRQLELKFWASSALATYPNRLRQSLWKNPRKLRDETGETRL